MRDRVNAYVSLNLKEILQCELHDPWVQRGEDLPELARCEIQIHVPGTETVGYVEGFSPEFNALRFADPEDSR